MPEILILENGEPCHATELTLILTDDVVAEIQRLADGGDEVADLLWTAILLDREPAA
ncbi:MAG: hypothetical protein PHR28_11355 [candidate division Zixibacteria bacterium]|jgi:hypothetical protein|nr:hypothetical protein [candidate division Zixibacteria bacterium]